MRTGPVHDLLAKSAIRADLTPDEAAAIFWILTDPALFHQLVVTAGWSRDRFREWLLEAFQTQILAPATPRPSRPPTRRLDRWRRADVHMPGIDRHSSVSMVPPIVRCGWLSSRAANASCDSACRIE